jgi:hypothetical protein
MFSGSGDEVEGFGRGKEEDEVGARRREGSTFKYFFICICPTLKIILGNFSPSCVSSGYQWCQMFNFRRLYNTNVPLSKNINNYHDINGTKFRKKKALKGTVQRDIIFFYFLV